MSYPDTLQLTNGGRDRRWLKRGAIMTLVALPFAALVVAAVIVTTSKAAIRPSSSALATLKMPVGGAKVTRLSAIVGREAKNLPVKLVGDEVMPTVKVATGQPVTIVATVSRPGWNSWLAGKSEQIKLHVTTPKAKLASDYVTVKAGQRLKLRYSQAVTSFGHAVIGSGVHAHALSAPKSTVGFTPKTSAGTMSVLAAPEAWEIPARQTVSWFPAGTKATAIASPAPGAKLTPQSPITLTFNKPVAKALSGAMPTVSPADSGTWAKVNSHTIRFEPSGYGYGLGAKVQVNLPSGIHLIGGTGDPVGTWSVPSGSTARLQQLLSMLGYLPLNFKYASGTSVADTMEAEEQAAVTAPTGSFSWRYPDTPSALQSQWQAGTYGELTKAAVMAFESNNDMTADGIAGPAVWKSLIQAALKNETNPNGYTFVYVHEASSGETETTWHDGRTVASGEVNTGTAAAGGTATGVYAVFEHLPSTTMSGVNPDGSHYTDPGIPDVSYFNGGDALHGYIRSSYGFPQSDGCVEMPYSEAAAVYPYTPVGTVVDVATS